MFIVPTAMTSNTISNALLHRTVLIALIVCHIITSGSSSNSNLHNCNGLVRAWILPASIKAGRQGHDRLVKRTCPPQQHFHSAMKATATIISSTTPESKILESSEPSSKPASTAIVGGGPAGLATALMLARRGYQNITVLERLEEPPPPDSAEWGNPERSYNLGIGGRGQVSLRKLGAADGVFSWSANAVVRYRESREEESWQQYPPVTGVVIGTNRAAGSGP